MSRKLIVLLCSSFCLVCSSWTANAQQVNTKKEKSRTEDKKSPDDKSTSSSFGELIADRLEFGASAKMSAAEAAEAAETERLDALKDPSIDLYGENSWGNRVNPIAGNVEIPSTYEIDLSGFVTPLAGKRRVSSGYGYRSRYRRMHYGVDIPLKTGDSVSTAFDGKVRYTGYEARGYGHYVIIRHANGLETIYGHLSRITVKENQIVLAGQNIGLGGSTGRSSGPHLHFECRFLGQALNPKHLFDFEQFDEAVPLKDTYTFRRGASNKATASSKTSYANQSSNKNAPKTVRVKKGDTLDKIAKANGTTVAKLRKLNANVDPRRMRPGQSIRIS